MLALGCLHNCGRVAWTRDNKRSGETPAAIFPWHLFHSEPNMKTYQARKRPDSHTATRRIAETEASLQEMLSSTNDFSPSCINKLLEETQNIYEVLRMPHAS